MWHDVTVQVFHPVTRTAEVHVLKVDAASGDDAVAQAKVRAAEMGAHKIVCVYPSAPEAVDAPMAAAEGDDAPDDDERAALIQRAIDEGVPIDRRWGVARLRAALEAAGNAEAVA